MIDERMTSDEHLELSGVEYGINNLCKIIHEHNIKWWQNLQTGEYINRNVGELLMLIVSEVAEAMEAHRKSKMDDHLPHRSGIEVELADACLRIFDLAAGLGLDLGGAIVEKDLYNQQRADHKVEARLAEGGKKY